MQTLYHSQIITITFSVLNSVSMIMDNERSNIDKVHTYWIIILPPLRGAGIFLGCNPDREPAAEDFSAPASEVRLNSSVANVSIRRAPYKSINLVTRGDVFWKALCVRHRGR